MYGGNIYGSRDYKEGEHVYTSVVKSVEDLGDFILVKTYQGTEFMCNKLLHHKKKKDVDL